MSDHAHALLRLAQAAISELLDRLEAAEADALEQARLNGMGASLEAAETAWKVSDKSCYDLTEKVIPNLRDQLVTAEKERDELRARIEAMEKQEPVGEVVHNGESAGLYDILEQGALVYSLSGAQPAPSVPEGWLRAIDEALVVAHIGVANKSDTYEQARGKLDNLIGFHTDVATDPAVTGGWKLVPIEPTPEMIKACASAARAYMQEYGGNSPQVMWAAMLAAAPEAKP